MDCQPSRVVGASAQPVKRWMHGAGRGQGLLEFALILPLFLLLIFGILEFALINASIGAFNFATQDAARFAAINGPTDPNSDTDMLNEVIIPRVNQVVAASLVSIDVFKADEGGGCAGGGTFPCTFEDYYDASSQTWTVNWPAITRNDQLLTGDYLGVRVTYHYTYVTAFFVSLSSGVTLTAEAIQRVEPQEYTKKGAPPSIASRAGPSLAALGIHATGALLRAARQRLVSFRPWRGDFNAGNMGRLVGRLEYGPGS